MKKKPAINCMLLWGGILFLLVFLAISEPTFAHVIPESENTLTKLLEAVNMSRGGILISLLLAFVLGALHALTPGHGKTVVASYLIASKGRVIDAVLLGLTVTLTHVSSVVILGIAALFLFQRFLPSRINPLLSSISGLTIMAIGIWLVLSKLFTGRKHSHSHLSKSHHEHILPSQAHHGHNKHDVLRTIALGVSGGLVPCPGALAVLLAAIGLNRIGFGLVVIFTFSCGLAMTLIIIGILCSKAFSLFGRFIGQDKLVNRVSLVTAGVVILFGAVMLVNSLSGVS